MPFSESDRLKALPPYLFVEIDRRRRAALAAGRDVINFGVGDPDTPTHEFIIERMDRAMRDPAHHRYPVNRGLAAFLRQVGAFLQRRYGVTLDPESEILALVGSKEGLGHLPLAVVNPGQRVIIPDPAYPVYRAATIFAGGEPWTLPLSEERGWLPDLDRIPAEAARDAVLIYLNYPNNPTGAVASRELFQQVVTWARQHDVLVAHDAAYSELYLSDERPPSILEIPGAKDIAVEFHSLSKTFNMTGWRVGFVAGNAAVLAALARIKANLDSGVFGAIQEAGAAAYDGFDRPELARIRAMYRERAAVLCDGLSRAGLRVTPPKATFYVWAGVPDGYDSLTLTRKLLDEADIVCIPGVGFGEAGAGHVRFALTVPIERIRTAMDRMKALQW